MRDSIAVQRAITWLTRACVKAIDLTRWVRSSSASYTLTVTHAMELFYHTFKRPSFVLVEF